MYRNILVNALVNLGDVVLTTGAIALLRRAYPEARITMLVKPAVREAVENNPVIDDVIVFSYKAKENAFAKMWNMVRDLRHRHFDLSISLDRKLRPALLAFLARIPTRIGPSKVFDSKPSRVTWLYTKTVKITHDLDATLQAETYQSIVRGVTGQADDETAEPVFARIERENDERAAALLSRLPQGKMPVALCVKGTFPLKTWPKVYFGEVVKALKASYDAAFFIVGAPGDKAYAEEVIAKLAVPVKNFCGETNLVDLAALIKRSALFVTVDTGAAHIAATTGTPMVVVYGCTHPQRWHPIMRAAKALTADEPCCPCTCRREECPSNPKPHCLWHVTPERAIAACEELIQRFPKEKQSAKHAKM